MEFESITKFLSYHGDLEREILLCQMFVQSPPNFLRASDLSSHVKPMVVMPEPDVSDVDSQNEMDMTDAVVEQLIDTSSSQVWPIYF